MIKNYDPNNGEGTHIIRVTFMQWDYVGHIAFQIGGNCRGASLLNTDFLEYHGQDEINDYVENDCQLRFDEDYEIYTAMLANSAGETLEVDGDENDFENMIIGIEIADFIEDEN